MIHQSHHLLSTYFHHNNLVQNTQANAAIYFFLEYYNSDSAVRGRRIQSGVRAPESCEVLGTFCI